MHNVFQQKRQEEQRSKSTQRIERFHVRLKREIAKRQEMQQTAELRREEWAQCLIDPVLAKSKG